MFPYSFIYLFIIRRTARRLWPKGKTKRRKEKAQEHTNEIHAGLSFTFTAIDTLILAVAKVPNIPTKQPIELTERPYTYYSEIHPVLAIWSSLLGS
jgi:hypothetical protein